MISHPKRHDDPLLTTFLTNNDHFAFINNKTSLDSLNFVYTIFPLLWHNCMLLFF